jgi:hypothetical protein
MRIIKISLGLVAMLLVGIVSTGSALAAGEQFLASESSALEATKVKSQVFVTNAGTVTCTALKILSGTSTAGASTEQLALVDYEKCTAFGFVSVTISPADYDFNANGKVNILKLISIKTTGCEVSVPAQTVGTVAYKNVGKNIELVPAVEKIKYTAEGSTCKEDSGENGKYTGTSEVTLKGGGTISWDS